MSENNPGLILTKGPFCESENFQGETFFEWTFSFFKTHGVSLNYAKIMELLK